MSVLQALKQLILQSVHLEYFALVDNLMIVLDSLWKQPQKNWRVLAEIFILLDDLQENLNDQKQQLRFLDNIEICLNMPVYMASKTIEEFMNLVLENFSKVLTWLTQAQPSGTDLMTAFKVEEVTPELIDFILSAFLTLLRDRSFGYNYCPEKFLNKIPPVLTITQLISIIKNEQGRNNVQIVLHALQILDGMTCLDLIKEFKDLTDKKSPYFKEACKHFNFYATTLRTLAQSQANDDEMQIDQQIQTKFTSQKFLLNYLIFLQDIVELKTRDMEQSLYSQLVEPLVHIITVKPTGNKYHVNLFCQEQALTALKTITKRSLIFDDSNLLQLLINRLKIELRILQEDLSGQPCLWKANRPYDDIDFDTCKLEKRQKFIKDCFGLLCYAVIRIDPTRLNQNQNFIAHSRKILESNLFEECLMDFVFLQNSEAPSALYTKIVDPIFMECVQLYTIIGNDLPQKIGDLIDSGLIPCILNSLDRRIPIQNQMLQVVIKFFKMLNLNQKGTDALLASQAVERFFELGQDYRSYKMFVMPRGSNPMFDQRQLVNNFANLNQVIAERIYAQCLLNLTKMQERSWDLCREFLQMEKDIDQAGAVTDAEKAPFRNPYGKKQINYEQALEASVALLSCFCMDELEYLENVQTHNSCVMNSIKARDETETILKLLRTPIICSAADGFIYHFQESATLILMLQNGLPGFEKYLETLVDYLKQSFSDLYTILGTQELDSLMTIETTKFVDLAEDTATDSQRESLKQLKQEDVVWVAISKIHMLIEMIIILGTLSKFHEQLGVFSHYTQFINKFLAMPIGGYQCIAKLQHLLHRYYSNVYVEQVQSQFARKDRILQQYRPDLEKFIWGSFRELDEPYSDLEDARNIYYRYELQTVDTLEDKKAEDLTRLQFEFVLPENKGVIQTFKCYKKIKNLMGQLAGMYNKRRYHFKDPLQPQQIIYNEMSATFVADQLRLIASRCTSTEFDMEQTLRTALLIDRILPDLSRQIGYKWKNQLNGIFLFSLLNQESVVDVVGMILEWAVLQYVALQEQEDKKILFHARNIQIIIRECVHFLMTLLKVTYLCNGNLQTYLAYFRRDKSTTLFKQEISQYFPKCFTLAKNLLYKCVLLPMTNVMFSPQRQCLKNWRYFGGGIAENVIKVYSTLCQGAFKDPFDFFADQNIHKQIQSDMPIRSRTRHNRCDGGELPDDVTIVINPDLVQQLIQMGFTEAAASAALRKYGNDFEFALEALLLGEFVGQVAVPDPDVPAVVPTESPLKIDMTGLLMYETDFGPETEPDTIKRICDLLRQTFIPCISTCLSKSPINQKRSLINKLFSFYKDFKQTQIIQDLIAYLAQEMLQSQELPDWFFVCYTIQLLQYAKEPFVQSLNLTQTFTQLIDRLKLQAQNASQWTKLKPKITVGISEEQKDQASDLILDQTNEALYNIHVHLSLLYFLLTDFHSQQELAILQQLVNPIDIEDKSAFEEPVTYQDIELIKQDALFTSDLESKESKEPVSLIQSEAEREIIVKAAYQAVMQLLGSFAGVEYSLVLQTKQAVQHMLGPCLKVLKMISNLQFPEFDFRQSFLKDNGLKTLFEMNIIDTDFQAKRSNWATDRHVEVDLKDLIDNVWQPPKDLQRWYETLIQRQMFFQFKANFKRKEQQQRDPCDYIISGLDLPQVNKQEFQIEQEIQGSQTKKKVPMPSVQQPINQKRNKSQAKITDEPQFQQPSQKDLKRLLKKYEDLNEQSFSEFVKYYNSNIFQHVIVHFNTFLAACAKTCVIKKVPKKAQDEESKDQQFELKIMLKKSLLMSMVADPNFNYSLPQKLPLKPKPDNVTKNQNEIVNQLLEIFIAQTKGYRMEILKQLRETKLTDSSCLQITEANKLCLKPLGQERRIYFLDHVNLLRALATIIGKNNSVVGLIYKHNDSKTVKFIIRNVYYLLSLHVDSDIRELQMNLNIPFERQTYVVSFFVHLLLLNHGSSVQDRALKKELGSLFVRQLAKSLTFKPTNESLWTTSSQLLQKFSSIWILGKFLLMKSFDTNTKDALGAICQKKTKYQRLQRNNMVKQLIIQCNQLMPSSNQVFAESGTFALLECIQNASIALQTPDLFLFGQSKNQCLSLCVSVITKVLRLFENSQSLGKFFKSQGDQNTLLDYSSANEPSDIDMLHEDGESGEDEGYGSVSDYDSGSDSDSDDFPPSGERQHPTSLVDLMSDQDDEEMEEGEDEDYGSEEGEEESEEGWEIEAIEEAEVEMTELLNSQQIAENPQTGQKSVGPPPPISSSSSEHGMDDDPEDDDEENSWEDGHMNREQISYQDQESDYDEDDENADEYDSYEDGDSMNSREGLSYEQEGDSEPEYEPQPSRRQNRTDRRAFILSQSHVSQQRQIMSPEFQMNFANNNDHFNLEDNAIQGGRGGLPMMTSLSSDLQRIIYQNADILSSTLNDQFMHLMDRNNKDGTSLGGGFIQAIGLRKQQISELREKIKVTEGFYQQIITTFMAAPIHIQVSPKPANSATADSSDMIRLNPSDYKDHMKPQVQLPPQTSQQKSNNGSRNPLVIEGMDPLFMESLSAIGLQNIADSHQIHAQLTQQQPIEMMQDFARFMRSQTQQRRSDILRQIQSDQCRDLPSEIFAEMRELYLQDRESFMRVLNQPPASRPQPPQRTQEIVTAPIVPPRDRLMSQDSVTMSLDLYGPADSQTINKATEANKLPQVETIRGDQFVQNFFIVLQDMNARYERDPQVAQCDRQAEGILQHALIPLPTDSAQVQYQKIKGTVETAQTAFMNLDLSADTQLTQSIKILHRIPNIRICLILKVVKQGLDEITRAKRHCEEQIELKQQKPYHTKLVFSENQDSMIPFANTVIGALKTTTQLQTSIENEEATGREVMEIVQPLQHDQLICKFAQMIGLEDLSKSIVEYLLDLMLEFWDLCHANPWVINSNEQVIQMDIQQAVMEQIFHLLQPVMKEVKAKDHKLELPLTKLCKVFLNRHLPLVKKSLTQVCATLNDFTNQDSIEVIQKFLETKVRNLLVQNMQSLHSKLEGLETESLQIESTVEIFKVTQQLKCLKTKNVCEEALMLQVFEQASTMVKTEEQRCIKAQKDSMFVFREEVKDLLNLVFSLCEYNLKLIFAKKETKPETDLLQIQSIDKSVLQKGQEEEPKSFMALLESHLPQTSADFKRFQTIMQFLVDNKKLINKFIQLNHSVINKELIQVALMIPQVLDFDTKRAVWKTEIKRMQSKYKNERFQFQIRREHTLQDSYAVMQGLQTKQWRGRMQVEFTGEDGIDEGGLFKEWISNVCKELFNEDMALFIKAASGSTYYPNPQSTVQPNYIEMFTFAGKFVGKALWDFQLLDCYFVKAFYKIMLGMPLSYHDLEDYDSSLYNSLNWMIKNQGVESICSSFVETVEYFGEQKEIELCEGGKDITVTDENKYDYVQQVANYRLYKAINPQIDAFMKGLNSVIPQETLKIFDNRELELLISGLQIIDIDDLRENTLYQNYTAQSKPVQFLFEALQEFDNLERAEFIRFVTGSSKVPVEGFKGLRAVHGIQKFTVVKIPSTTQGRLPQSHTCMNQLDLPEYQDKETCKKMLLYAIKEGKTFGFA